MRVGELHPSLPTLEPLAPLQREGGEMARQASPAKETEATGNQFLEGNC